MTIFRFFLKNSLYLAAVLLLPGALIGAPILWWLGHRNARNRRGGSNPASIKT
jgi:hypothetical protein